MQRIVYQQETTTGLGVITVLDFIVRNVWTFYLQQNMQAKRLAGGAQIVARGSTQSRGLSSQ